MAVKKKFSRFSIFCSNMGYFACLRPVLAVELSVKANDRTNESGGTVRAIYTAGQGGSKSRTEVAATQATLVMVGKGRHD